MPRRFALIAVKVVHTLAWAVFAGCILVIPVFAWRRDFGVAAWLIAIVMGEVVVLAFNGMRCPLTAVAARYTPERQDNFDIYLPLWLARHNKTVFGSLFAGGLVFTLVRWWW